MGYMPFWTGGETEAARLLEKKPVRDLIDALSDEELFVSAHVLLTHISEIEFQAFPTWNGLKIEMAPDGAVTIDPDQRRDLALRWERWYQDKP